MTDGVTIRTNLPDFKRQLARVSADMEVKVVRSAVSAAAEVYKKAVIASAPVASGTLRRAIYKFRRRNPKAGTVIMVVGFRKGKKERTAKGGNRDAFYGRFLEGGWTPRAAKAPRAGRHMRALQRRRAGGQRITKYRFIAPAFQRTNAAALEAFNRKMVQRLEKLNRER